MQRNGEIRSQRKIFYKEIIRINSMFNLNLWRPHFWRSKSLLLRRREKQGKFTLPSVTRVCHLFYSTLFDVIGHFCFEVYVNSSDCLPIIV